MTQLTIDNFKTMLATALSNIKAREDEFSKLDAVIGDGDHGQAIVTAMSAIVATAEKGKEFKTMLNDMGFDVMMQVSDHASGTELDTNAVKVMFAGGLANVQKQTKAQKGDKTMMDALIPAVEAIQNCLSEDIKDVLNAGAEAALVGAQSTINLKANFGRARNYGERSIGYMDSGAASWSCMFASFAEAAKEK